MTRKLAWLALSALLLWTQADGATISRPTKSFGGTSFVNNVVPLASDFNGDIDTIYNDYNGNITNANISASAAIAGSKLLPNFTANLDVTNAAPCQKLIESDQSADARRWDLCVDSGLWQLRTVTDAGATTNTLINITRSTGNIDWFGKFTKYNNVAPTDGQLLIGNTAGARFDAATLTGTTNQVTVTNGAGTVTLALPTPVVRDLTGNVTGNLTGLASTATALASDPTDCTANKFANAIAASGNLTCATPDLSTADVTGTLTVGKGGTGATSTPSNGQIPIGNGSIYVAAIPTSANNALTVAGGSGSLTLASFIPRSYLAGCILSTAGASTTMTTAACQATDSGNTTIINLSSSLAKTTGSWAVGAANGCLDTGSISASTWYHFYVIRRSDTGVVDVLCSLSASAPTMPTNYDTKRRTGSAKTDGSSQWTKFVQDGDLFMWDVPINDVNDGAPGTSAVTRTLTVPTGVVVWAWLVPAFNQNLDQAVYLSSLDVSDQVPAVGTNTQLETDANGATQTGASGFCIVKTNTSAQIRSRMSVNQALLVGTLGWRDPRGKDN